MLYVLENNTIKLTRGDTAKISVSITNDVNLSDYTINDGDILTLTVKKSTKDQNPCIQKTIVGSNVFILKPEDTKTLPFGKYKYDVQLTTAFDEVYTVIEPSVFEILQEVTY